MKMTKWIAVGTIVCTLWLGNSGTAAAYPVVAVRPGRVHYAPVHPVVVRPVCPVVVRPYCPVVIRPAVVVPQIVMRPVFCWWWW
jgi:hypothetical protein